MPRRSVGQVTQRAPQEPEARRKTAAEGHHSTDTMDYYRGGGDLLLGAGCAVEAIRLDLMRANWKRRRRVIDEQSVSAPKWRLLTSI